MNAIPTRAVPAQMKRKTLWVSVAAVMLGASTVSFAQEASEADEIIVTGIRGSLTQSMDIKKNSAGVVDAISSEDIGKMPDTNLAESLQRVTGVSIDRQNGEGSRVTVRGFGPDYNLITLNGRQMPAANLMATSASNSRSYDFAQLAAESVSGVEVYKTGQAKLFTGGIGSTINIKTAKPLDNPGLNASVGAKLVSDTSNRKGSDLTPELSGIYSNTTDDGTFGVALSGSYQERDSGYNTAETSSGWYTIKGTQGDWGSLPTDGSVKNRPQANDVYSVPRNILYSMNDVERKRTNGQLTLQWAPSDALTTTLDYTYSKLDIEQQRQELSAWFNGIPTAGEYTQGTNKPGSVVGPVIYGDATGADIGMGAGNWGTLSENNSVGFNAQWKATDHLTLVLDYHNSSAEAGAKDGRGTNNVVTAVQYNRKSASVDYSQDMPVLDLTYIDGKGLDPAQFLSSGTSFRNAYMKTDLDQLQLNGSFTFDDSLFTSIDFGVSTTDNKNRSAFSNAQRETWGGYGTPAQFDDSLFKRKSLKNEFKDLSGSNNPNLEPYYYEVDFKGFMNAISNVAKANKETLSTCGTVLCADPQMETDRLAHEEQQAAFVQSNMHWDSWAMPTNLAVGVRYESTDVHSDARVPNYTSLVWESANEFKPTKDGFTTTSLKGDYANWLPNVDFDIAPRDDLKLRASYSVTIARPSYSDIQGGQTINIPVRFNGGTGNSGNPDLDPFESTNMDLSTEWYYAEGSYVSLGYYKKDVKNFIGNTTVDTTLFNLAHPAQGPRYDEAVAATGSTDGAVILKYMQDKYGTVVGDATKGDKITHFSLTSPVNAKEAVIDGWEFAVQHLFGESGFGGIINYTTVNGDIGYDNYNTNKGDGVENQFALLGLSDSANLVAFYDKNGVQARIAYNWRDDFLVSTLDGNGERNPIYTGAYGQIDVNMSYNISENLRVFAEGINITSETQRLYGRHENMVIAAIQSGARYNLGVSYKF